MFYKVCSTRGPRSRRISTSCEIGWSLRTSRRCYREITATVVDEKQNMGISLGKMGVELANIRIEPADFGT